VPQAYGVSTRRDPINEAARRIKRQLDELAGDLRAARIAAGLSQAAVARQLECSRQLVTLWERGEVLPYPVQLARWAAVLGLEVSLRAFVAGSPLRDAGQLRLIARARPVIGHAWTWQTEVPVSRDPRDRRAFDAVLTGPAGRIGLEAITRLTDAQAQVRAVTLKQGVASLDRMVLVLADTRHNRAAVAEAAPTLKAAFSASTREVLGTMRAGRLPPANGIVLV
jgi:transcriptional regulator with XRE-family HTH domain